MDLGFRVLEEYFKKLSEQVQQKVTRLLQCVYVFV